MTLLTNDQWQEAMVALANAGGVVTTAGTIAPAASQPGTTNVGADTAFTLSKQANRFLVQNNTSADAYIALDATASTASLKLVPGATWIEPIPVTTFHVFTAAAQPINAANGILLWGWS